MDIYVFINGARKSLRQLSQESGVAYETLCARWKAGIPADRLVRADEKKTPPLTGAEVQSALGYAPGRSNPNLLDNWYFGNPVNQRGTARYEAVSTVYMIDRWLGYSPGGALEFTDEGVNISSDGSSTAGFYERVETERLIAGETYTLSALLKINADDNTTKNWNVGLSYGVTLSENTGTKWTPKTETTLGDWTVVSFTFELPESAQNGYNFRIRSGSYANIDYTIKAMKLELGDTQTLAHQDSSGNWVLNEIPNYGEQLARCQRYQTSIVSGASYLIANGVAWGNTNNQAAIMIPIQVPMRTAPALSSYSVYKLYVNGSEKGVTSLSVLNSLETGIRVRVEADSAFTAGATIECMLQNVFLDANL